MKKDPTQESSLLFEYPDEYFKHFEDRLQERLKAERPGPEIIQAKQRNLPIWWHAAAASIIIGLFAFALWPHANAEEVLIPEDQWLASEIASMHEVELIEALYGQETYPDSLAHLVELIEWDAWEWLLYEEEMNAADAATSNQF